MLNLLVRDIENISQVGKAATADSLKNLQRLGRLHAANHITPAMFVEGGRVCACVVIYYHMLRPGKKRRAVFFCCPR